jgi:hypothetical protein
VTNSGDVAAPNTVITIPAPPTGYTLGPVRTDGGGTCTPDTTEIRCTGVTVPGPGSVTVSLPVTRAGALNWAPGPGTITAVSTPIAALTGTTISVRGSGPLVTAGRLSGGVTTAAAPATPGGGPTTSAARVANTGSRPVTAPPTRHLARTTSDSGPPRRSDVGGITQHRGVTSVSPSATAPNDNSNNGGDGADNNAGSGGTDNAAASLPEAGQDLSALLVLSVMLVVGGVAARIVARNRPRRRSAGGAGTF